MLFSHKDFMINQRKLMFKKIMLVNLISDQMLRVWFKQDTPHIRWSIQVLFLVFSLVTKQELASQDICLSRYFFSQHISHANLTYPSCGKHFTIPNYVFLWIMIRILYCILGTFNNNKKFNVSGQTLFSQQCWRGNKSTDIQE